jgi:O-antigen/teichoic acid export membrane protein
MTVLFGASYAPGWAALLILVVGQLINAGTGTLGAVLVMSGHQRAWLLASGTMMVAGVAITCALTPIWGLAGAALGTTCAVGGLSVVGVILTQRALHISPYDRRYCKGALAAAASVLALLALRPLHIYSPLLDLLATAGVTVAVFAATLLLLGLDDEDRQFIKLVRARIG